MLINLLRQMRPRTPYVSRCYLHPFTRMVLADLGTEHALAYPCTPMPDVLPPDLWHAYLLRHRPIAVPGERESTYAIVAPYDALEIHRLAHPSNTRIPIDYIPVSLPRSMLAALLLLDHVVSPMLRRSNTSPKIYRAYQHLSPHIYPVHRFIKNRDDYHAIVGGIR